MKKNNRRCKLGFVAKIFVILPLQITRLLNKHQIVS